MKDIERAHLSWDDWDELHDPRPEDTEFDAVVASAMSRRGFLGRVLAMGSGAAVMGTGLLNSTSAQAATTRFAFTPIPIATDFTIHVPEGYNWAPVAKWGDALFSDAPDFDAVTGVTPQGQARAIGENTDGMELFNVGGRQVIAVNHEYANTGTNLPRTGGEVTSLEDVTLLQNAQGVAVFEVAEGPDGWQIVVDSDLNRRITHTTPMTLTGPAASTTC